LQQRTGSCFIENTIGKEAQALWIFSIYGMYSIACARKPNGSLDPDNVMVRARRADHLRNLQKRFLAMAGADIVTLPNRDYRYRLIVPKSNWAAALAEMAGEQKWSNFKDQVAKHQGRAGAAYTRALHDVWETMYQLQESEVQQGR
jgi:hypothetical protein